MRLPLQPPLLALSPTTFTHGANANVSIAVAPTSGTGMPTGDVSLVTNLTPPLPGATAFTLNAGAVSSTWNGLPGGTYDVHAHYAGDATFAASDSAPVTITVSPEGSTTTLSVFGFDCGWQSHSLYQPALWQSRVFASRYFGPLRPRRGDGQRFVFRQSGKPGRRPIQPEQRGHGGHGAGRIHDPGRSAFHSGQLTAETPASMPALLRRSTSPSPRPDDHDHDCFEQQQRGSGHAGDVDGHGEHQQRRTAARRALVTFLLETEQRLQSG